MTITVHHLNNSRSQRVLWLLEELEIPYEIKQYQREPNMRAPKALLDVHALGKSPVITDSENNNRVIAESGAIVDYLIRRYGAPSKKAVPTSEDALIDDTYWSHFAEGTLMPTFVFKLILSVVPKQASFLTRPLVNMVTSGLLAAFVDPENTRKVNFVSEELTKKNGGWFAGGDKDGGPVSSIASRFFTFCAILTHLKLPHSMPTDCCRLSDALPSRSRLRRPRRQRVAGDQGLRSQGSRSPRIQACPRKGRTVCLRQAVV